jgi:death on curing protein
VSIRFLSEEAVRSIHTYLIDKYGGAHGLLNASMLDSAIGQPKITLQFFPDATLCDLAAVYGYHICKNHAFNDGNKRTARMAMITFLKINGLEVFASEDETLYKILDVASGKMTKLQLADWLSLVTEKISS